MAMHASMTTPPRPLSWPRLSFLPVLLLFLLAAALPARAASTLPDTELAGDTYRSFELVAPVPDFCRKVCEKDEGCRAWTFAWPGKKGKRAKCLLKRSVSEKRKDTCCVSGYKRTGPVSGLRKLARRWLGDDARSAKESTTRNSTTRNSTTQHGASSKPRQPESAARTAPPPTTAPAPAQAEDARATEEPVPQAAVLKQKRMFCRQYAQQAMNASRQARRMGCGFRGGRWGASFNGYFNWCMRNDIRAARSNTQRRTEDLHRCALALRQLPQPPRAVQPADPWEPPARAYRRATPPGRQIWGRAPFIYSWLKRSGPGPRATPWRPSISGKCPLVRACACPQGDTCRVYEPGEITVYWPLGCNAAPASVVCRVRRR